jgi:hypothetical protein
MAVRADLHPLLVAPPIGGEVRLRLTEDLVTRLAGANWRDVASKVAALRASGRRGVAATVVLGIGRSVTLPDGGRVEVCAPDHVLHVRCEELVGKGLLAVAASECDLRRAPAAAQT